MPYITQRARDEINLLAQRPSNAGELNYVITSLIHQYIEGTECYQTYNDVIGVLEGAKLELYRRHVAPYEDQKIKENGDVPERGDPNVSTP